MKKSQYVKQRRIRQRNLERVTCRNLIWHIIIIIIIMLIALHNIQKANKVEQKEDCYKVVKEVKHDSSDGVIYFESCADEDN